jgi:hypothetical protein
MGPGPLPIAMHHARWGTMLQVVSQYPTTDLGEHLLALAPSSPYVDLDRAAWSRLSASTPLPLTDEDVERLRGLGDPIDLAEVDAIYRPLSRLLNLYVQATGGLHDATSTFLHEDPPRTPYVIGVAGSSGSRRRRASCARCSPAGPRRRASSSSPPTGSSTRTPSWNGGA